MTDLCRDCSGEQCCECHDEIMSLTAASDGWKVYFKSEDGAPAPYFAEDVVAFALCADNSVRPICSGVDGIICFADDAVNYMACLRNATDEDIARMMA